MSRHPRPEQGPLPAPRRWSSLLATLRSALSWTLSSPTRARARRLARRREKAELLLRPLLVEQTEQLADSLMPQLLALERQLQAQTGLLATQQEALRAATELLGEVLNSLMPEPEEQLVSLLSGPFPQPSSLPDSAS